MMGLGKVRRLKIDGAKRYEDEDGALCGGPEDLAYKVRSDSYD
jgi:hypothetical protein